MKAAPFCVVPDCGRPFRSRGYCQRHYNSWHRYGDPLIRTQRDKGAGTVSHGYHIITLNGRRVREHVAVAERALGKPLPRGAIVHHVDEDPLNNAPANLVICPDNAYHRLIHRRLEAYKACGNPDWRKCVRCGLHDDPANMRMKSGAKGKKTCYAHLPCLARARRALYTRAAESRRRVST